MRKHNKKRNVGIIYELLLRHMSDCIIEGNNNKLRKATSIIEKRFKKDTELYKEFRLFNALAKSSISSTEVAAAILTEAKNASRRIDTVKLDKEKSSLIRDINFKINDKNFYYRKLPNYTDYATIQTLLNEWRKHDTSNLKKLIEFEKKIIDLLLKEKIEKTYLDEKDSLKTSDSNELIFKLMTEKINNKYKDMHSDQKEIIKMYAFYRVDNRPKLLEFLSKKRLECVNELNKFKKNNENKFLNENINNVKIKIQNLDTENIDDVSIVKFLTLTKLINEFKRED